MVLYIVAVTALAVGLIFLVIKKENQINKIENKLNQNQEELRREIFEKEKSQREAQIDQQISSLNQQIIQKQQQVTFLTTQIKEKQSYNTSLQKIREDELDRIMEEQKLRKETQLANEINEWKMSAQDAANEWYRIGSKELSVRLSAAEHELEGLKNEISDFQKKREVINQEIMRAREIEEKEDFYRIQLAEDTLHDLSILHSIRSNLRKVDFLDKLMYDIYVKKSVDEMIKRVLNGRTPCGIYKVTRIKTGEVYVGKSTDVKSRWQQHTKSAYHCGTISHSTFHTTLEKDGLENFTWELLEEVPKDKLGEREKYWINFYDSKNYGMNEKVG